MRGRDRHGKKGRADVSTSNSEKFSRVFEQIDDIKERVTKIEVFEGIEKEQLKEVSQKIDEMRDTLNRIVGKDSARAAVYGVIGSIVAAIVTWILTLIKGS